MLRFNFYHKTVLFSSIKTSPDDTFHLTRTVLSVAKRWYKFSGGYDNIRKFWWDVGDAAVSFFDELFKGLVRLPSTFRISFLLMVLSICPTYHLVEHLVSTAPFLIFIIILFYTKGNSYQNREYS